MSRNTKAFVVVLASIFMPVLGAGMVALAGGDSDCVAATFLIGEVVCILFGVFAGMVVDP